MAFTPRGRGGPPRGGRGGFSGGGRGGGGRGGGGRGGARGMVAFSSIPYPHVAIAMGLLGSMFSMLIY